MTSEPVSPRARLDRHLTVAAIACCVVAWSAVPASAIEPTSAIDASEVATLVSDAAPDLIEPAPAVETGNSFEAGALGTDTSIPVSPDDPIDVSTTVGGRELSASITLPEGLDLSRAEATDDGTVVYTSDNDASVAVQALETGDTRVHTVIPDRHATHDAEFGMDGFRAVVDTTGNAAFVQDGREGVAVPVDAPWATDASGAPVSTHYEVRGDRLVQIVSPTDATTYPIVADPTWGWRNATWGLTLTRSETANIKDYAGASSFCAALAKDKRLVLACGLWSGYLQVQAATANNLRPKGCLHIVVAPLPGAISHTYC